MLCFNEAAAFAAEQHPSAKIAKLRSLLASMRLRLSPQSNVVWRVRAP